ncbi:MULTISPECIES: CDP-glycerol glycerophosphotransferase family protein [Clostridium]|uniref:CDP-glycerol glycerophosphotransferase family protein n=1 Tax=Clostridium TaxID=1485 RepID=UPI000772F553|nr:MULTISPECIES: CDP-glycerol glycerophosphotransferase family protein [Clostridium]MBY6837714.1 CDP-glycerol glycerophosphotransferase family protein [Clostridium botulinum]MCS6132114.1 hypothetical protein [Clostridium botulinum]NFG64059.1 hypothetical protein [Clostridium botulinum]NFH79253.1 hypothetical protein [Clostridium botulinum]NFH83747.1 hypothetical protein [Clostridium botulinum]
MKTIFSSVFSILFKIFNILPKNKKKITFILTHDDRLNGNVKYLYEEIVSKYPDYKINIITRNDYNKENIFNIFSLLKKIIIIFFVKNYHLATSKYIILNNIFITAAYFNFKKEVKVMQVWHAIGTFKKFGEDYEPSIKINNLQKRANRIYTEVVVCSEKDRLIYSKAFNVDINKTKSLGSPICDLFQDDNKKQEIKQKIYNKYSKLKQKKIYLYAPTFRDTEEDNLKILSYVEQIGKSLDENTILILRLHPHIYKKILYNKMIDNVIDMSNYDDVNELMIISDVLITDYSSLFYEYSYLEKPIIFFAFDLKDYENKRGFYYNYIDYVPGEIIFTIEELISRINQNSLVNKSKEFKEQYFDYRDGNSCERIVENLLK